MKPANPKWLLLNFEVVTMLFRSESNYFKERIRKTFQTKNQTIFQNQTVIPTPAYAPTIGCKRAIEENKNASQVTTTTPTSNTPSNAPTIDYNDNNTSICG